MICGYCQIKAKKHPVEQCKYVYIPVFHDKKIVGYEMNRFPLRAIHGTDKPTT